MIIESLFNLFYNLFFKLFNSVNIPSISTDVVNDINSTIDTLLLRSSNLIDIFIPYSFAKTLLSIVISIELFLLIYKLVMWVLRKIPMLNIH